MIQMPRSVRTSAESPEHRVQARTCGLNREVRKDEETEKSSFQKGSDSLSVFCPGFRSVLLGGRSSIRPRELWAATFNHCVATRSWAAMWRTHNPTVSEVLLSVWNLGSVPSSSQTQLGGSSPPSPSVFLVQTWVGLGEHLKAFVSPE